MKLNTTTLVLGLSLAVVAGLFASSTIFGSGFVNKEQTAARASAFITGHVTTIQKDSQGDIIAYRQTDNQIVNQGENCASKLLFSKNITSAGGSVCAGANTQGFRFIQIGNGTTPSFAVQVGLASPHNKTSFGNGATLNIGEATTVTWTNNTSSTASSAASVVLSKTFTNGSPNSQTVTESGLFNSTDNNINAMFARQTFSSISLAANDQLTVQWTINVGGTSTING
ncbi:MAG: hypothetical protein EB150_09610 [Nitrososphaeria archaeon]|nr:hypothetical protein [Nitrososphaeria archaeon]NDB52421.1 hypothetical protein [Nitrosopumilaceae archaeon]NDB89126.1 hypothetical protein [Nitrososphaerota archaeon]NDB90918.1 hypothetical protein [Nitrososphaerota archaeon]NDB92822.1 hypothetical protein [Nitrososphaeria archaeon]